MFPLACEGDGYRPRSGIVVLLVVLLILRSKYVVRIDGIKPGPKLETTVFILR